MLNENLVSQVNKTTTGLFTTAPLNLNSQKGAFQSTAVAQARPVAQAPQMSAKAPTMGFSIPNRQRQVAPTMAFAAPQASSSNFFGNAAAQSAMPKYDTLSRTSGNLNMSMANAASSGRNYSKKPETMMMGGLGNSVNMMRHAAPTASSRSSVRMMAVLAKDEQGNMKPESEYMDKIFLQQKYDNVDHLDVVIKYTGNKYVQELQKNAKKLAVGGKGILASDESNGTCGKRFEAIGVENTEPNRKDYRELLYTTKDLNKFVSGAIMYDETIRQKAADGTPFTKVLADQDILTGIKVDTGIAVIEGTNDETVTMGLDGLSERATEYYELGARFAKWRAVLKIDKGCPSDLAIKETAHSLARYALICQHAGLVPIVEPEILTDGTHDIKTCARVSEKVFNAVMNEVVTQGVILEGMLLKPNMVTSGAQAEEQAGPEEVAFFTVRSLARTIPPAVPGITFLSGGQSEEVASQNLNAINRLAEIKHPWNMTYSFGRALQSSVLSTWQGKKENVKDAQDRLYERCGACSAAALGKYEGGSGSTESDYVANYVY